MQVAEKDMKNDAENTHLVNIGTMVQDMENKMLSQMKEVYFGKTQETTKRLRYLDGSASRQAGAMLRQAFVSSRRQVKIVALRMWGHGRQCMTVAHIVTAFLKHAQQFLAHLG